MRYGLVIAIVLAAGSAKAQDGVLPSNWYVQTKAEILMQDSVLGLHPEMRPYSFWNVQDYAVDPDTNYDFERLAFKRKGKAYLRLAPIMAISAYNQAGSDHQMGIESIGGVTVGGGFRDVLYFSMEGLTGYAAPPEYYQSIVDSLSVSPGFGYAAPINLRNNFGYNFSQITGHVAVRPSEYIELRAGRGRHFIGEGYRSVFLSDFSSNLNYFRIDVSIWKLKYMVLYSQMEHSNDYPRRFFPTNKKYATTHYLSLNLTKWWSIGAFESVVWEAEDSVITRNFDFNYLNPIIFLRPVEYAMGSSDNSLLGFSSTIRPTKGLTFYGQILLDEFVFSNYIAPIRNRLLGEANPTGWWGNKQSYQVGIKVHEPLGWRMASVLAEVNVARPFTYGHSNPYQSYTHMNQPLAHPLGANFIEWVQLTTWQPGQWELGLMATYSRKGYTNNEAFLGEDILVSNTERSENREFGNPLLQGWKKDVGNIRLDIGRTIIESWNLKAQLTAHYRIQRYRDTQSDMVYFGVGIQTVLWPDTRML